LKHLCNVCDQTRPYPGWDACLKCGTAVTRVEDPAYIEFANKTYASDTKWLADLNAEWKRQSEAEGYLELAVRGARACA
jgi:hypothetical protein